ncbi:hypothetical protein RFI_09380 [Reticulomyxa filosa]|uniref:Uncharacterized protein n=1 Tax=Reticulomyxa filosa TaxID=46433 RepID=X6NPW5_RETFI|nr:hypothetical protein RFI_09380 [Reticulomyxa filosa]|eukprot:ETO27754.1 hypothetical protein RFI_09380 [Reticulomyxa filosa]
MLYRSKCEHSEKALKYLTSLGLDTVIALQDVTVDPPRKQQLFEIRQKLELPFSYWTEPPLADSIGSFEEDVEACVQKLTRDNYRTHQLKLPIIYHRAENHAIIARPVDRIQSILNIKKKEHDPINPHLLSKSRGPWDYKQTKQINKVNRLPQQDPVERSKFSSKTPNLTRSLDVNKKWHEGGANSGKYYDVDEGHDWTHVDFENYDITKRYTGKGWSVLDRTFTYNEEDYDSYSSSWDSGWKSFKPGFTDQDQVFHEANKSTATQHHSSTPPDLKRILPQKKGKKSPFEEEEE